MSLQKQSKFSFGCWGSSPSDTVCIPTSLNLFYPLSYPILGTREFEVTADRQGCYRPEDLIDNPSDYADDLDATKYDRRLRGAVNERVELAIDSRTGLKNSIANEVAGIMTSALHVRKLEECMRLGRSYGRGRNKAELCEELRLMGTGLHCLEGKTKLCSKEYLLTYPRPLCS